MAARLKVTCERCTENRVKCGKGPPPCPRCKRFGYECIFRPQLRRGPVPLAPASTPTSTSASATPRTLGSVTGSSTRANSESSEVTSKDHVVLAIADSFDTPNLANEHIAEPPMQGPLYLRRWRVFFAALNDLAQTPSRFAARHSTYWLGQILVDLQEQAKNDSNGNRFVLDLKAQLAAAQTHAAKSAIERMLRTSKLPPQLHAWYPHPPVVSTVVSHPLLFEFDQDRVSKPTLEYHTYLHLREELALNPSRREADLIQVSAAFETVFGHSSASLRGLLGTWPNFGVLPWGLDVLTLLLQDEAEAYVYLQSLALKFSQAPVDAVSGAAPSRRRRLSTIQLWDMVLSGGTTVAQFLVRIQHLELVGPSHVAMNARMTFEHVGTPRPILSGGIVPADQPTATSALVPPPYQATVQDIILEELLSSPQLNSFVPKRVAMTHDDPNGVEDDDLPVTMLRVVSAPNFEPGAPVPPDLLAVPVGAVVEMLRGDLQTGLEAPYEAYVEIVYQGNIGKIARRTVIEWKEPDI